MAKYFDETLEFLRDFLTDFGSIISDEKEEGFDTLRGEMVDENLNALIAPMAKSAGFIQAGDLVIFKYKGDDYIVLICSARGGHGLYQSHNGNMLLSGFKLNESQTQVAAMVVNSLYKNEAIAFSDQTKESKVIQGVKRVLGPSNFRTFLMIDVVSFNEIQIVQTPKKF